jgi:hypothetical protein
MDEMAASAPTVGDIESVKVEDLNEWFRYFGALPDDD